jgi:hypothetical protein
MSPITSIELFFAEVRTRAAPPSRAALARRLSCWLAYYRALHFVRERYGQTNTAYLQTITTYFHTRERLPTTTAEHARAEAEALRHQLHEKSVSFSIFAIGLLDSIADTFQCYFGLGWPRSDSTHARLTRDFPPLCREKGFVLAPTALPTLMRELHATLVVSPPSLTPVIDERPEDRLTAMSTAINVYIAAMMQFFARNETHSVLRRVLVDR